MTRLNQTLVALLLLQLVIAAAIYAGSQSSAADQLQKSLLDADSTLLDQITINHNDGKKLLLSKKDGLWILPDYHHLPARQHQVEQMLSTLRSTTTAWPIATTSGSQQRFEVSTENYQVRISLAEGDETVEQLYLGTSPGFRQLHLRRQGENDVFAVNLNSYDFPAESEKWLDTRVLQPNGTVTAISGSGFDFTKQADQWLLHNGEGTAITEEVNKLVNAIANLQVVKVAMNADIKASYSLHIKTEGQTRQYDFHATDDNYFVHSNDYTQWFKITKSEYEKINRFTADQLIQHSDKQSEQEDVRSENRQ